LKGLARKYDAALETLVGIFGEKCIKEPEILTVFESKLSLAMVYQ